MISKKDLIMASELVSRLKSEVPFQANLARNDFPASPAEGFSKWRIWRAKTEGQLDQIGNALPSHITEKIQDLKKSPSLSEGELSQLLAEIEAFSINIVSLQNSIDALWADSSLLLEEEICSGFKASPDFRSVNKFGHLILLQANEAEVIRFLVECWKNGTPEVSHRTVLERVVGASGYEKVKDLFQTKNSKAAYRALIKPGKTRGTVRLNIDFDLPPQSPLPELPVLRQAGGYAEAPSGSTLS